MDIPILIMNIKVFSSNTDICYLTSSEGILKYNHALETIQIPLSVAKSLNGGPLIGEQYLIYYADGMINDPFPHEFYYIGTENGQLVFSQAPPFSVSEYTVFDSNLSYQQTSKVVYE